jgi:hypothetical protein
MGTMSQEVSAHLFVASMNLPPSEGEPRQYNVLSTESNVGEVNSLGFEWREGNDTLKLTYFAHSERHAETVSLLHTTTNECRK